MGDDHSKGTGSGIRGVGVPHAHYHVLHEALPHNINQKGGNKVGRASE